MTRMLLPLMFVLLTVPSLAAEKHKPYAGFESRDISSLSGEDIQQLENGSGWGLALPAELNGYPGPAHILELKNELELTTDQVATFEEIFNQMRKEATQIGHLLIEAERALDQGFELGELSEHQLRMLVNNAEKHRANLRYVHLSRHLASVEMLTSEQIELYAELRGYAGDPCADVPEGHDPEMWLKHNGCR